MRFSNVLAGAALALTISHALSADVVRWDNGQVIPGTEGVTPGPGVSLTNLDLQFAQLYNFNLTGSDFSGSNLTRARLDLSQLTNVKFRNAILSQTNLHGSLTGVDFTDATITDISFAGATALSAAQIYSTANYKNKDLSQIGFAQQNLAGWDLRGQNLSASHFFFANLSNADLRGANLLRTNLRDVTLTGAKFDGANITSARLQEATTHNFTKEMLYSTANYLGGDLGGVNLASNNLSGWSFNGQELKQVSFLNSDLSNADFTNAKVSFASLSFTTGFTKEQLYSTASYQTKDLSGVGLGSLILRGWNFRDQDLTYATLTQSDLVDADFTGALLAGASLGNATTFGFTKEQLYSTSSYEQGDLAYIKLGMNNLANWDFSGQMLVGAEFGRSNLSNADFTGAIIHAASFYRLAGEPTLTKEQLYSTASYQAKTLFYTRFGNLDFTGWDLSGQNLMHSNLLNTVLTNADLTGADLRGATDVNATGAITHNTIGVDGIVHGLDLQAGETLRIVDFDSLIPEPFPGYLVIPVTIEDAFTIAPDGALSLEFDADNWDSTIHFESGLEVQLQGTLRLGFTDDIDLVNQVGRTFKVFDWTGVSPTGQFDILAQTHTQWDLSRLYTTGEVTLVKVPEPSTIGLGAIAFAICAGRYGLRRRVRA